MRFPEFSGEWEKCTLGSIGETFNGLTGKSAVDFGSGSPYITYKSIFDSSKIDISKVEYVKITETERVKQTQNEVEYGDIFFTTSSETPEEVGMASVLLSEIRDCYLNSFCFGYRLFDKCIHQPDFFRFYLRSSNLRKKIAILAQGSTRFNISKNEVMKMPIFLPSLAEQRKISKLLSLIEDRIETQKKVIEDLKKLKDAISKSLFSRYDLLEAKMQISQIGSLKNGYAFQSSSYDSSGEYEIITIANVAGERHICTEDCNRIHTLPSDLQPHQEIKDGDILISLTGNVGRVSLCKEGKYLLNQRVGLLQLKTGVNREFVYQVLSSHKFELSMISCGQGAAQMNIGKGDVESYEIPYSNNPQNLHSVSLILKSYDKLVLTESMRLQLLLNQKQYIISNMFI